MGVLPSYWDKRTWVLPGGPTFFKPYLTMTDDLEPLLIYLFIYLFIYLTFLLYFFDYHLVPLSPLTPCNHDIVVHVQSPFSFLLSPSTPHVSPLSCHPALCL